MSVPPECIISTPWFMPANRFRWERVFRVYLEFEREDGEIDRGSCVTALASVPGDCEDVQKRDAASIGALEAIDKELASMPPSGEFETEDYTNDTDDGEITIPGRTIRYKSFRPWNPHSEIK